MTRLNIMTESNSSHPNISLFEYAEKILNIFFENYVKFKFRKRGVNFIEKVKVRKNIIQLNCSYSLCIFVSNLLKN